MAGEWFAEMHASVGEQVYVPFGLTELVVGERVEPADDFGFEFDRSPTHSSDAITLAWGAMSALSEDSERAMVDRYTNWTDQTDFPDGFPDCGVLQRSRRTGRTVTTTLPR